MILSKRISAIVLSAVVAIIDLNAQTPNETSTEILRPVSAAYTASVGYGSLTDTYLSPLKYTGSSFSLDYERRQAMKMDPEHWSMRLAGSLEAMHTTNIARNATLWDADLRLSWGMYRRFRLTDNITIGVGGSTSLSLGCLYNRRNGNNPVSAKASLTVDATGYAAMKTHIGSLPVTLCYKPTLPVTGAFFSPDYGELYYEIYLGNHNGLAHWAWWGNYFAMENLLTADFHFSNTALRLGFRSDVLSTRVNNINTRIISAAVVIGVSGEWISIGRKTGPDKNARIISAIF